ATKDELDMTLAELRANLRSPTASPKLRLDMNLEFHRRFALPFACFVFALIGVPFGIQNQRSGKAAGFAVSIGLLLIYYVILSAGKALGQRGLLPPFAAVWTPNILFLVFGIYLFRTTAAEKRFFLFDMATRFLAWLREAWRRGNGAP
ncbi:MAG TPA: LptF/LptG family permease, partial [Geobacteraceae bacterium]